MQPTIPLSKPLLQYLELQDEIDSALSEVMSSGRYLNGPWTERFNAEFAQWCGVRHCVAVGNGTDALELSMRALGIGAGDEVVTVANAGGYTTAACRLVGAAPVWVDVRADTLGLDIDGIERALSERVKLIVVTHLYGVAVDAAAVRAKLDRLGRKDIKIIEDCAQAHGATIGNRRAGSMGDIATFSFYPTKNLGALGDAGAVVTNDADLAAAVSALHQYGWRNRFHSELPGGRNSRIDEIQAAVLTTKLPHLERWNARRREIFARYAGGIQPPCRMSGPPDRSNVVHLAVMRTPNRGKLRAALAEAGVATDIHYPVLDCDQASERVQPGRPPALIESIRARDEILSLPCYPGLSEAEVERVISAVNLASRS